LLTKDSLAIHIVEWVAQHLDPRPDGSST
jgi:hypothetical protein